MNSGMTAKETAVAAWKMAIRNRSLVRNIVFHSDRGAQYANHEFRELLIDKPVQQSMSRKGNCWDNGVPRRL
jgi:putative transposase